MSNRMEALEKLARAHWLDPDEIRATYARKDGHFNETAAEDLAPFLAGEKPLGEWCAVTQHGAEFFYLDPTHDTARAAQIAAGANINDSIHDETPVRVVNLDTGEEYAPEWSALPWKATRGKETA